MTIKDEKRGARDYFWFALALIVVLIGSASRASAADVTVSDPPPRAKASPVKKKPTAEELSAARSPISLDGSMESRTGRARMPTLHLGREKAPRLPGPYRVLLTSTELIGHILALLLQKRYRN